MNQQNYVSNSSFPGVINCNLADSWNFYILGSRDPAEVKIKVVNEEETNKYFHNKWGKKILSTASLAWKTSEAFNNKFLAEARQQRLLKLNKFEKYENVLAEWEKLCIIEQVEIKWYESLQWWRDIQENWPQSIFNAPLEVDDEEGRK